MLTVKGLTVSSGRKTYLKDVSFEARSGRLTGVVGLRGSGKTELVRAVMGLIDPTAGSIELEGNALGFGDRQNFGYLPRERGGYPRMKVMEQIVYLARLHGMTLGAAEHNAVTLLARLDLSDRAYAQLNHLSGSEVACVDIAAVLAADPDVVVLDEPFDGLDADSAAKVFALLRDHAESGVPVLFTTEKWKQAQEVADDLVILSHGRVAGQGTLEELQGESRSFRVRLADAEAAAAAGAQVEKAGAEDVVAAGTVVTFRAADEAAAATYLTGVAGAREFGPVTRDLSELFKESV
ncbi:MULTISPECIES: ABC transporter ATP-binding protein [Brevibacterium]|uniref:ATP-binding cassette domain-containing protein n=1 Tax=Brevibacterium salitolerans TaxID=1403566 RepID=A0ABN2WQI2_9MICO|nr:ATP-binding cassette domain-containing protein [Brevibacterium sp.]